MYLDEKGELRQGEDSSTIGYRAAGVPGTVAGMDYAFRRYGSHKVSWPQLIEPARRLAADGFRVSRRLAQSLRSNVSLLERYPDSRRIFLRDGNFYREGEVLRQPELRRHCGACSNVVRANSMKAKPRGDWPQTWRATTDLFL